MSNKPLNPFERTHDSLLNLNLMKWLSVKPDL